MQALFSIFDNVTFLLLLVALGVFGIFTIKQKKVKSFQFQMSIVILVLIVSEVIDVLFDFDYVENNFLEHLGAIIHVAAMAGIALIFWGRFINSKKAQKNLTDDIQN